MKRVICYGDSNTYGYHPETGGRYPKGKRWPFVLSKMLGPNYSVISDGLNGRTTAYDMEEEGKNGLGTLSSCLNANKPVDILIFMLGTNDCCTDLNLSAEEIAYGMERLVKASREVIADFQDREPEIIIVAPPAILSDYMTSPFAAQINDDSVIKSRKIAPLYRAISEKYGCKYLECTDALEISSFDSEHLTEKGHEKLAEMLYELLTKEALKQ